MRQPGVPDIDRILDAIRAEARARGSQGLVGSYGAAPAGMVIRESHGLAAPDVRHVADFLALPPDVFLQLAYRQCLGRDPDAGGAAHYQRALLRGRLTRVEVLGRLAFSPEGRRRGRPMPGLLAAFLSATAYRIPLAGPILGVAARLLRMPAHLQDRSTLEAAALATGSWMKR